MIPGCRDAGMPGCRDEKSISDAEHPMSNVEVQAAGCTMHLEIGYWVLDIGY
jgi:hypothetical protein